MKVLLINNQKPVTDLFQHGIQTLCQHSISCAQTPQDATQNLSSFTPDVILWDYAQNDFRQFQSTCSKFPILLLNEDTVLNSPILPLKTVVEKISKINSGVYAMPLSILVLEKNSQTAESIQKHFSHLDCKIEFAEDEKSIVQKTKILFPDIVIINCKDHDCTNKLKNSFPGLPIFLTSTFTEDCSVPPKVFGFYEQNIHLFCKKIEQILKDRLF